MDHDADLTAREWLSRPPTDEERDAELARLRERLAFYQSFEGLIQDNIARSGDLLRQAMQMRETAAAETIAAREELDRQRTEDRDRHRLLFSGMLDEVSALQGQAERLARRLTDALDRLDFDVPATGFGALPTDLDLGADDSLMRSLSLGGFADAPFADLDAELANAAPEAHDLLLDDVPTPPEADAPDPETSFVVASFDEIGDVVRAASEGDPVGDVDLPTLSAIDAAIDEALTEAAATDASKASDDVPQSEVSVDATEPAPTSEAIDFSDSASSDTMSAAETEVTQGIETSESADLNETADSSETDEIRGVETAALPDAETPLLEEQVDIPLDIQPFAPEDIGVNRRRGTEELVAQPPFEPEEVFPELSPAPREAVAEAEDDAAPASATIVLVHGVPRATTALSLKRYLENLAHVSEVEPREFAEGILRLSVSGHRPLAFDDLRSWSEGAGLEPVHLRDDLVEVRMTP